MRKAIQSCALAVVVVFSTAYSCQSQTGPSQPTVSLAWTQSTATGVTANCVYRSVGASSVPAPPAIYCSPTPVTAYTDATVSANTTYVYAVTAKVGQTESSYSNTATAVVPANPPAPSGLQAPQVTKVEHQGLDLQARVEWRKQ
jgi:fibronectin type 3 domain-containing protein